jgi:hypothetical protein
MLANWKDEKKIMKKMNVIAAGAVISLLLSGCGAKTDTQGSTVSAMSTSTNTEQTQQAAATPQADQTTKASQDQQQASPRASTKPEQRQLMTTLRSLITMDKKDGLTITKEQAVQMLPIVQESITNNELTSDNQSKLVEKLTADQKKFLDDEAATMQKRMANGGKNGNGGSPRPSPSADGQKNQSGKGNGPGGGANIGQQFVELLQSKTK